MVVTLPDRSDNTGSGLTPGDLEKWMPERDTGGQVRG
jgi:hypothetical protein